MNPKWALRFALMREAYGQMPESWKQDLYQWEAENLPERASSEWPGWDKAIDCLTDYQVEQARKAVEQMGNDQ